MTKAIESATLDAEAKEVHPGHYLSLSLTLSRTLSLSEKITKAMESARLLRDR
jgi:hypothetical protein